MISSLVEVRIVNSPVVLNNLEKYHELLDIIDDVRQKISTDVTNQIDGSGFDETINNIQF